MLPVDQGGKEHPKTPVKVTVLMTLYNKGEYVEEAIRSILKGSFDDFEILVIDDASTDDGPRRVAAIHDPRIRLVTSKINGGRAAAANRGYEAAMGIYIAVLDADDTAHPERLAKQVAFMDANPEVGVSGTAVKYFGAQTGTRSWPLPDRECRGKLLFTDPVLYGSCIIRRSVIVDNGLRSNEQWTIPGEDYVFMVGLSRYTQFANLPEPLLNYRIGEQNQRHGRDPVQDREQVCRWVFNFFGIEATDEEFDLQLIFHGLKSAPINGAQVRALWAWRKHLVAINRSRCLFPIEEFEDQLANSWARSFHMIADNGFRAGLIHMYLSGSWPMARILYLIKVTIRRAFGLT